MYLPGILGIGCLLAGFGKAIPTPELHARQLGPLGSNGRPTNYTVYSFEQLIDHFPNSSRYPNNTNATFSQKYVVDDSYYKPGGPVSSIPEMLPMARS